MELALRQIDLGDLINVLHHHGFSGQSLRLVLSVTQDLGLVRKEISNEQEHFLDAELEGLVVRLAFALEGSQGLFEYSLQDGRSSALPIRDQSKA